MKSLPKTKNMTSILPVYLFLYVTSVYMYRASGIGVCLDWVSQSIEYLSRKGIVQNDPKLVAAQVYALFLDSDLHEIASNEGVLPMNAQAIESGMLSSSSDDLLILQVSGISIPPLQMLAYA